MNDTLIGTQFRESAIAYSMFDKSVICFEVGGPVNVDFDNFEIYNHLKSMNVAFYNALSRAECLRLIHFVHSHPDTTDPGSNAIPSAADTQCCINMIKAFLPEESQNKCNFLFSIVSFSHDASRARMISYNCKPDYVADLVYFNEVARFDFSKTAAPLLEGALLHEYKMTAALITTMQYRDELFSMFGFQCLDSVVAMIDYASHRYEGDEGPVQKSSRIVL